MPEAPELFLLREYLAERIVGKMIIAAEELRPLVVRNMLDGRFVDEITGRSILDVTRKGKLITLVLSGDVSMVVSPMLTGELRLQQNTERVLKSTIVSMDLGDDSELRYIDPKRMGQIYLLPKERVSEIARIEDQGPDIFDEPLDFAQFQEDVKPFRGEIKGVLTRGRLVSGIGNAYADEVLWDAGIYPFKKVGRVSDDEMAALHSSLYSVPAAAVNELRSIFEKGDKGPRKERGFLSVHGKSGDPPQMRHQDQLGQSEAERDEFLPLLPTWNDVRLRIPNGELRVLI